MVRAEGVIDFIETVDDVVTQIVANDFSDSPDCIIHAYHSELTQALNNMKDVRLKRLMQGAPAVLQRRHN